MKKIFSFVLMSLVSLFFITCSDDDEKDDHVKSDLFGIWFTTETTIEAASAYYDFSTPGRYEEFYYYDFGKEEEVTYMTGTYICSGEGLVTFTPDYICYAQFVNGILIDKEIVNDKEELKEDLWMTAYRYSDSNNLIFGQTEFEKSSSNDLTYQNIKKLINKAK
ncbi:MAG: hypothetical protein MJ250_09170 [Alphaproteobacteria bacterium]|nr:hypothetical protein [Alphaproteobacteria bacterium]